jgi:hypothetical protein
VANIYTSGSIIVQAIVRKPGSLSVFVDRFVEGKGDGGFGSNKFVGLDGASSICLYLVTMQKTPPLPIIMAYRAVESGLRSIWRP